MRAESGRRGEGAEMVDLDLEGCFRRSSGRVPEMCEFCVVPCQSCRRVV